MPDILITSEKTTRGYNHFLTRVSITIFLYDVSKARFSASFFIRACAKWTFCARSVNKLFKKVMNRRSQKPKNGRPATVSRLFKKSLRNCIFVREPCGSRLFCFNTFFNIRLAHCFMHATICKIRALFF